MSTRGENDVGMTEYLTKLEGFNGIIKQRFQDFLVNELDEDGQIVCLLSTSCEEIKMKAINSKKEPKKCAVLTEENIAKLHSLMDGNDKDNDSVLLDASDSKDARTEVHEAIRCMFPKLESETVNSAEGDGKLIKITKISGGGNKRSQRERSRGSMPRKSLCKFVLYKENIGTMEAINTIVKRLKLKKSNGFQYAGTKDKRGITAQLVTAPVPAERLCGLNKSSFSIKLGNFSYCSKALQLGDLQGNRFSIVIRHVGVPDEIISEALSSFGQNGFINYFGMQRFGTTSVPTYEIGKAIFRCDWQKVVNLILHPREEGKDSDLKKCLQEYAENGDASSALKQLRFHWSPEAILLKGIEKYGKNQLLQAITMIPRNMRLMYVHSYQSFVWNRVASKRIKGYGKTPVPGDLVYEEVYKDKRWESNRQEVSETRCDNEPPVKKLCSEQVPIPSPFTINKTRGYQRVKILTDEDVASFTLQDILLPLPGHDITYPKNLSNVWYQEIMKGDGIDVERNMVHKIKEYSLPGAYRYIVIRPSNVDHEIVNYNDHTMPLFLTDLDKLSGKEEPCGVPDGQYKAVRARFNLPSSSYATVALREILKIDMSSPFQTKLNEKHTSDLTCEKLMENDDIDVIISDS